MSVELLSKLSEPFPIDDVKQRRQGNIMLDYISIDATIRRLNEVVGSEWSTKDVATSVSVLPTGGFLATVSLTLEALGKTAVGVGADNAGDADKAIKTALAEALKKAGHQFGIGLYLWEESERAEVARQRKVVTKGQPKDGDKIRRDTKLQEEADAVTFGTGSF